MPKPVVAIVGRPNVGKSTLFNRLIGERQAIIEDEPGTTRDRIYSHGDWNGRDFTLIDTGGIVPEAAGKSGDAFTAHIRAQARIAIEEADVILFLVDARDGMTSSDEMVAELLRRANKPVVLVANKADNVTRRDSSAEFYQFGLGDPYPISAFHGTGTGDMLDQLVALLPPKDGEEEVEDNSINVAIVGRPNVGKSALLNALLGYQRAIVSEIAGTTRDAIDTSVEWEGQPVTLIDTAGIRRRGRVEHGVEQYSVVRSLKAVNRADVVLLVIDSDEGLTAQDAHVAGYVQEEYAGLVIVMNKWDLVAKDSDTMQVVTDKIRAELNWVANAPLVFVSALTGQRVNNIPAMALKVAAEREQRVPTSALNKLLRAAFEDHQVTLRGGKRLKFFYATQPTIKPPTFVLYVNAPEELHFSYRRYVENTIRREYGFEGVPFRLSFRGRDGGR